MQLHKGWFRIWVVCVAIYFIPSVYMTVQQWPPYIPPAEPRTLRQVAPADFEAYQTISEKVKVYRDRLDLVVEDARTPCIDDSLLVQNLKILAAADEDIVKLSVVDSLVQRYNDESKLLVKDYGDKVPGLNKIIREISAESGLLRSRDFNLWWEKQIERRKVKNMKESEASYRLQIAFYLFKNLLRWFVPPLLILLLVLLAASAFRWIRSGFGYEQQSRSSSYTSLGERDTKRFEEKPRFFDRIK